MSRFAILPIGVIAWLLGSTPSIANQSSNKYLKEACISALKNQLVNPQSSNISSVEHIGSNGLGSFIINYSARSKSGATVKEGAFCELTNRATVSIVNAARSDFSHLK